MKSGIKERAEDAWAVHTQRFHEDEELALMSPERTRMVTILLALVRPLDVL
jgi:hypothetical protein